MGKFSRQRIWSLARGLTGVTIALMLGVLGPLSASTVYAETLQGTLDYYIVDYPDGSHRSEFTVTDSLGREQSLEVNAALSQELRRLGRGADVKISGRFVDAIFEVTAIDPASSAAVSAGILSTTGTRAIAAIIVNLSDATNTCTSANLNGALYRTDDADGVSVRGVYEQSSDGLLTFNSDRDGNSVVDIFGPYTISNGSAGCDYRAWGTAAEAAATAAGVNLSLYNHRLFIVPQSTSSVCGWAGIANLGCSSSCRAWSNLCTNITVIAHELGHNFGYEHSATDSDNNGTVESQYGDYSCDMGAAAGQVTVFNAPKKDQLGWFDHTSGKVIEVTSTGSYTLAPLELKPSEATSPQVLKIRIGNGTTGRGEFYYISYRSRVNSYGQIAASYRNKTHVHRFDLAGNDFSKLIKTLGDGQSFTDSTLGLTVSQTSNSTNSATVQVTIAGSVTPLPGTESGGGTPGGGDSDGDGVSDAQEGTDGSDASDPGSFVMRLQSPIYVPWNSFLSMTNILELINPTGSSQSLSITLYSISGQVLHSEVLSLESGAQFDRIVNDMPNFVTDSYGLVRIDFSGAKFDGRMSFYRSRDSFQSYEFAYSVPFRNPNYGTTAVGFNTFQPSTRPADASFQVANWLSLINLSGSTKTFSINTYGQSGTIIAARAVSVGANSRLDIDGGHGIAGSSVVGVHQIIPSDRDAPYMAQLVRYGTDAAPGGTATSYFFAFPLEARTAIGTSTALPISTQFAESNWLELINTRSSTTTVNVDVRNQAGTQLQTNSFALGAYAQYHLDVGSILGSSGVGQVLVSASASNSIVMQSMFYHRDTAGGILAMHGSSFSEPLVNPHYGSYNLFLGMQNWLRVFNSTGSTQAVTLVTDNGTTTTTLNYSMPAYQTLNLPLHEYSTYGTATDSYGRIQLSTTAGSGIFAELLRLRPYASQTDFTMPTLVRPQ